MTFARRVVIDTGVLVSAAIRPGSVPALAFEKAMLQFDICTSSETLAELETVLLRPKFECYLPVELRRKFLVGYRKNSIIMIVDLTVTDCIDPGDNKFLELAEAANAEIIVASDPHLTNLHPWREIPILPPAAFLIGVR